MAKRYALKQLLKSRAYILITPDEAIMEGDIAQDGWDGFLQQHSLYLMQHQLNQVIKRMEAKHGREQRGRSKGSPKK